MVSCVKERGRDGHGVSGRFAPENAPFTPRTRPDAGFGGAGAPIGRQVRTVVEEPCPLPSWDTSSPEPPAPAAPLSESLRADAIVVGAGITGSSTALHLARAGKRVVQIEAREPGWGSSGRAFGNVVPVSKHGEGRIERIYGPERGRRLNAALAAGPETVRGLLTEFQIDAVIRGAGWLLAAHTPRAEADLKRRANGCGPTYHDARETADLVGSRFYRGSLIDPRAFAVNALTYARGLARAARQAGVSQFCNTPATRIERSGAAGWTVSTPAGEVVSDTVFICTNAYTDGLWPGLARTVVPVRGYTAVSRPFEDGVLDRVLPHGHFLTDTRHLWSGIRKVPGNRLHVGAGGPPLAKSARADLAGATRRVKMVFPELGAVEWEEYWSGWVALTAHQLPRILRLDHGVWAALGYSGRGLSFATLLGRELSTLADGATSRETILPVEEMRPLPCHALAPFVAAACIRYFEAADRWSVWRHRRRHP